MPTIINSATTSIEIQNQQLQRYIRFLEQDLNNLSLRYDTLMLAAELGDITTALALIEGAPAGHYDTPFVSAASHILLSHNAFKQAVALGSAAIHQGVSDLTIIFNTAFAAYYLGEHALVVDLFSRIQATGEEYPTAGHIIYARACYHIEDYAKAIAIMTDLLVKYPDNAEAIGLLALLHYELDENAIAQTMAQQALAIDPDQFDALLALAEVQLEADFIFDAEGNFQRIVANYPESGRAWASLAQIAFQRQDFVSAEKDLLTAVKFMPDHIGTWHILAWIYILRPDTVLARQVLDQAYALDRNFGETHGSIAVIDIMEGHIELGEQGMKRALKLDPDCKSARYAESLLLQRVGQFAAAQTIMQGMLDEPSANGGQSGEELALKWLATRKN